MSRSLGFGPWVLVPGFWSLGFELFGKSRFLLALYFWLKLWLLVLYFLVITFPSLFLYILSFSLLIYFCSWFQCVCVILWIPVIPASLVFPCLAQSLAPCLSLSPHSAVTLFLLYFGNCSSLYLVSKLTSFWVIVSFSQLCSHLLPILSSSCLYKCCVSPLFFVVCSPVVACFFAPCFLEISSFWIIFSCSVTLCIFCIL